MKDKTIDFDAIFERAFRAEKARHEEWREDYEQNRQEAAWDDRERRMKTYMAKTEIPGVPYSGCQELLTDDRICYVCNKPNGKHGFTKWVSRGPLGFAVAHPECLGEVLDKRDT